MLTLIQNIFLFLTKKTYNKQIACSVTYTNKKVHSIIKKI